MESYAILHFLKIFHTFLKYGMYFSICFVALLWNSKTHIECYILKTFQEMPLQDFILVKACFYAINAFFEVKIFLISFHVQQKGNANFILHFMVKWICYRIHKGCFEVNSYKRDFYNLYFYSKQNSSCSKNPIFTFKDQRI